MHAHKRPLMLSVKSAKQSLSIRRHYDARSTASQDLRYLAITCSCTDRAVIIGSGLSGLAAAEVLSRHFSSVIVLEKDTPKLSWTGSALDIIKVCTSLVNTFWACCPDLPQFTSGIFHRSAGQGCTAWCYSGGGATLNPSGSLYLTPATASPSLSNAIAKPSPPLQLQYNHLQAFLAGGLKVYDSIFQGRYMPALQAAGGHIVNVLNQFRYVNPQHGALMRNYEGKEPVLAAFCSRHLLETTARALASTNERVLFLYGTTATGLLFAPSCSTRSSGSSNRWSDTSSSPGSSRRTNSHNSSSSKSNGADSIGSNSSSSSRKNSSGSNGGNSSKGIDSSNISSNVSNAGAAVSGVLLSDGSTVDADLVLDCSGRFSSLPDWLEAAGFQRPRSSHVSANCGYACW